LCQRLARVVQRRKLANGCATDIDRDKVAAVQFDRAN